MNLSPATVEAYLTRAFNRYTLKQTDNAINEIKDLQKKFKKFNFKTHGLRMTALEFFEIQEQLKVSIKFLYDRRAELSAKRFKEFCNGN